MLNAGAVTYTYDSNGNTISHTDGPATTMFRYDSENRLASAITPSGTVNFVYDHDSIRVARMVNGIETRFLVDKNQELAQVLEERDAVGNLLSRYVHGDDLISSARASETRFYHYDGLGSTRALTDATAAVTDTYVYEAFGGLLTVTGNTSNDFLFAGEQLDPNTGFYYLRARYYSPDTGRFLTSDPFAGNIFEPRTSHAI